MSQFYKNMQNTASTLLKRFGAVVTIRRTIPGTYDSSTGRRTGDEAVEWKPKAVKTDIKEEFQGGTRIVSGDMMLLVDCKGKPYVPAKGDAVIFPNGEVWNVVQDMPVAPADVLVLYKGVIRKG